MICKRGGFSILRHNKIRDLTANLLTEVCHNAEARLDIKARSFWNPIQDAFFDVRVFHPNASCYRSKDTAAIYRQHESAKKREYNQRIQDVEHGVFTPLVFSTSGGPWSSRHQVEWGEHFTSVLQICYHENKRNRMQ